MPIASVCWLIAMIVFVAAEASTVSLVALWFVGGALAAMIVSLLGGGTAAQFIVFAAVSAVLLALFRPALRKYFAVKKTSTNADRLVGQEAVVTQAIGGGIDAGEVKLSGVLWTALADTPIAAGAYVRVLRVEGAKVYVEPVPVACTKSE